jgi:hypothetical protein
MSAQCTKIVRFQEVTNAAVKAHGRQALIILELVMNMKGLILVRVINVMAQWYKNALLWLRVLEAMITSLGLHQLPVILEKPATTELAGINLTWVHTAQEIITANQDAAKKHMFPAL